MTDNTLRILLVDDDDIDRMSVTRHIRQNSLPYEVKSASSENTALDQLKKHAFDVILLDYNLGVTRGLDLLPYTNGTPVILVTGAGSETVAAEAMRKGAYDYLIKDSNRNYLAMLATTINKVLDRKKIEDEKDRLIDELREALAEIKSLQGIVPICANCKNIRDDKGFWQRVEVYLSDHSNAKFSHGICPDCIKKLYPQYSDRTLKDD